MGKGNKQTTNTQQSNTTSTQLPGWVNSQAQNNLNQGNWAASNYSPALQSTPAGMTQDQYGADYLANNGMNAGSGAVQSGVNAATGVSGYTPQSVNPASYNAQGYTVSTVPTNQGYTASLASSQGYNPALLGQASTYNATTGNASQINPNAVQQVSSTASPEALQGYLQQFNNVYGQQMQAAMAPLQQAYQQSINQNGAQAAQAGAFGDSRQGVMDAQSNGLYQQNVANLAAQLNGQALNNASSLYQQQQNNNLNAGEANQGAALSAGTTNANLGQGMTLANLGYANTAGQFNANANNNFSLANQSAANQAAQFGAGAANTASLANAGAQNTASQSGMQAQLAAELANQGSQNTANQFGASANNTAGQYNAGNQQQASLANQSAGLQGAGLNLSAAGTLGNLGTAQQGMNLNNINALNGLGTQQQNYNQNVLNTQYANQQAQAMTPIQQAELQQQFLQGTPYGTTTTSNGTSNGTTTNTPTLGSQIMSGIGGALQLGGMFAGMGGGSAATPEFSEPVSPNLGQSAGGYIPQISANPMTPAYIPGMYPTTSALFASDQRLKENIQPMSNAMDAVRKIKPAAYTWKGDPTKRKNLGLIAQNVEAAAPHAVSTMPNGVKAVHVPAMLGLLTDAVKHLDKKVGARK
jgi:hypothetical protein